MCRLTRPAPIQRPHHGARSDSMTKGCGVVWRAKRHLVTLSLASLAGTIAPAAAGAQTAPLPYVTPVEGAGRFPLIAASHATRLVVSPADFAGVQRAARDLASDLGHVSGGAPAGHRRLGDSGARTHGDRRRHAGAQRVHRPARPRPQARRLTRRGTLGDVPHSNRRTTDGRTSITRWSSPAATSAARSTACTTSRRQIGVSPWTGGPTCPSAIGLTSTCCPGAHSDGEPAVKYRGIFLNDEAPALSGWAQGEVRRHQPQVLREGLRADPAPQGQLPVAGDVGQRVRRRRHARPAARRRLRHRDGDVAPRADARARSRNGSATARARGTTSSNDSTLRAFWADGIRNMGVAREHRHGRHARRRRHADDDGQQHRAARAHRADQRTIIESVTKKPASETPQVWALYKEVQDYYDKGMRVPDDVTLLFSDDNWGNIRRLAVARRHARAPAASAIYYHFDYVGGPRNYKWINTNPIARVWEQMHLAYEYGARPHLDRERRRPEADGIPDLVLPRLRVEPEPHSRRRAFRRTRAAGPRSSSARSDATEIGDIITKYTRTSPAGASRSCSTRVTYSLTNYREAERVVASYDSLLVARRRRPKPSCRRARTTRTTSSCCTRSRPRRI